MGKFCGKLSKKYLANKKMTSTTNKIEINFVAGNNAPKRGFRFKIRAVPMDSQKSVSSKSLLIAPILSNHHSDLTLSKFKNYYQCSKFHPTIVFYPSFHPATESPHPHFTIGSTCRHFTLRYGSLIPYFTRKNDIFTHGRRKRDFTFNLTP